MRILAFDIGIKNLAWCLLEKGMLDLSGNSLPDRLIGLSNVNIIETTDKSLAEDKKVCMKPECKVTPSFQIAERGFCCRRHIPKDFVFLTNPDGKDIATKIPNVSYLKKLLTADEAKEVKKNGGKRDSILNVIRRRFAIPLSRKKVKNSNKIGPEDLHDYIRQFCVTNILIFETADVVLLENQPVFKNPHMKTVQILLFATLRTMILDKKNIPFLFIHAGKKTKNLVGVEYNKEGNELVMRKGDEGYEGRKMATEKRVDKLFYEGKILGPKLIEAWRAAKKKSDMADVVCMCCDFQG
jgi:hypothetical protein